MMAITSAIVLPLHSLSQGGRGGGGGGGKSGTPALHVVLLSLLVLTQMLMAAVSVSGNPVATSGNSTASVSEVADATGKIVNGHLGNKKYFSFQLLLTIQWTTEFSQSFCGGSIISPLYALTAAHCFRELRGRHNLLTESVLRVYAQYLNQDNRTEGTTVQVAELIIHPDFNYNEVILPHTDFAVLKFVSAVPVGTKVQSLRLSPHERHLQAGSDLTISGWGNILSEGATAEKLLAVTVNYQDQAECNLLSNVLGLPFFDEKFVFCGGCPEGGSGPCTGDSGGPATVASSSGGGPIQVGIVSWGFLPCTQESGSVQARVSAGLAWIEAQVGTPVRSTVQAGPTTDCDNCGGDQDPKGQGCAAARRYSVQQAMVESVLSASFRLQRKECVRKNDGRWKQNLLAYFEFLPSIWGKNFKHPILNRLRSGTITVLREQSPPLKNNLGQVWTTVLLGTTFGSVEINTPLTSPIVLTKPAVETKLTTAGWTIEVDGCDANYRYAAVFSLQKIKGEEGALGHHHQVSLAA